MNIKAIIFDLDGTLIDAYRAIIESFNFTMDKMGFPRQKPEVIKRAVGLGDESLLSPFIGKARARKAIEIYRRHHKKSLVEKSRLIKSVRSLLVYLRKSGYKLAVASNRPSKFSKILIKHLKIDKFFDEVLCGDELEKGKPHPLILFETLKRLSVSKKQALYVGDMVVDVKTGNSAGVKTIAVLTGSSSRAEIKYSKPYKILKDVSYLRKIL